MGAVSDSCLNLDRRNAMPFLCAGRLAWSLTTLGEPMLHFIQFSIYLSDFNCCPVYRDLRTLLYNRGHCLPHIYSEDTLLTVSVMVTVPWTDALLPVLLFQEPFLPGP